jgi:hypothetical protein
MKDKLIATLTQTRDRTPLAVIGNMPGDEAELTPAQIRSLAHALFAIADASEKLPMSGKHFTPQKREYDLAYFSTSRL